jgi:pimeloyl-ACP methyl ester carboxylesterase
MNDFKARNISIPVSGGSITLDGDLSGPSPPKGLIIFAHGSGSSRFSPRNRFVASELHRHGFATLLFDLLTEAEAADRTNVFDISLLADRVGGALEWVQADTVTSKLPVGLFGASTGAAAALVAAARFPEGVAAVVSRGGHPDLAADALKDVAAPTVLIVGGRDLGVIELNEAALAQLACEKSMEIVPGATHLFEEPGTMEAVVELAAAWFATHLAPGQ